jgi:hypothetical protein
MSLERQYVLNSSSLVSKVLVNISSSNSNLASLALYTLLVLLLDFLGLTGGLVSFKEDSFRGDSFFFLLFFLALYFLRSF